MQIAELKGFEGAVWARVPVELGSPIQILGPDEIRANSAEIERLTAENELLRAALRPFAETPDDVRPADFANAFNVYQQKGNE